MEPYIWFIASLLFFALEIITTGFFIMWFGVGSMIVGVCALFGLDNLTAQVIIFAVISLILVALSRTIFKNIFIKKSPGKEIKSNIDILLKEKGIVTEEINNELGKGRIIILKQDWSARSKSGDIIPIGAKVKAISRDGIKIIVEICE